MNKKDVSKFAKSVSRVARNCLKTATLFLAFAANSANADIYEDGMAAYKAKDYDLAIELWSSAELARDPRALYNLSRLYGKGKGVEKNQVKATELLTEAANMGHTSAQFNLGLRYFKNRDAEDGVEKAMQLWEQAAQAGHDGARYNIGVLLWQGKQVPEDRVSALKWFTEAFHNGNKPTEKFLYSLFQPMNEELKVDFGWNTESKLNEDVSENQEFDTYTLAQQAMQTGSYKQAYDHWSALAENGHSESQYMLAGLYEKGNGVQPNLEKALYWYKLAAESGQADAQFRLGLYHINEASDKNSTLGLYWIQSAADNKLTEAIEYLDNNG